MPNTQILINPPNISATDRSVQYGDASFTTMYAEQGHISLLPAHIVRLQRACALLHIAFNDWLTLQAELAQIASAGTAPLVIKIIISRGSGGRGYQPPAKEYPLCIISTYPSEPMLPAKLVDTLNVSDIRLPEHDGMSGIKHNNRLAQVLAKRATIGLGCDEVLMCNEAEQVIEASSANIFYQMDGCWYTPPLQRYGVQGVMRDAFLAYLADQGVFVAQASHHISQFKYAHSLFLSNAVRGIRPVAKLIVGDHISHFDTANTRLLEAFMTQILCAELAD
jgi:4-amino-4-deoxychorismate lyase